ncbi:MAG: PAS domain S-box protein, partial [Capsulimonas sp.]|uniref:PAS domain S-box protein n=1 Tax=Capsulimonas sp. TaxID=2494211 RepID=UPI00326403B8
MTERVQILIADDDIVDRMAVRRALRATKLPLEIQEATSCAQVIASAAQTDFDCVFLDFQFPDGDGLAVIKSIRATGNEAPIIVLTGHGDELVAVELMKAGASDYLAKSRLTEDGLGQTLQNVLRVRRAELREREMAAALSASEARFRRVAETNVLGIVFWNESGAITEANDAFLNLVGYTQDDLTAGRINWIAMTPPEYLDKSRESYDSLKANGNAPAVEKEYLRKDGGRVSVIISASRLDAPEFQALSFVLDVTERKRAEHAIQFLADASVVLASSLQYENILQSLAHLAVPAVADLCVIDMLEDGKVRRTAVAYADPALALAVQAELKQNPPDLAGGNPVSQVLRSGVPILTEIMADGFVREVARTEAHHSILRDLNLHSYIVVPLKVRGSVIGAVSLVLSRDHRRYGASDQLIAEELSRRASVAIDNARLFEATQQERTQLEASERRYRFLAEAIPQIVWTALPNGDVDYFNEKWTEYSGHTLEQSKGWSWELVLHPDDLARTIEHWTEALTQSVRYDIEYRLRRFDGEYRWHLARGVPIRADDGAIVKWFGTCTDIDDQKRAERAQRFLDEIGSVVSSSLDYEETLNRVAELVTPSFADWCAVDLLEEDGELRRVALSHADPAKLAVTREIDALYPTTKNSEIGIYEVIRNGESLLETHVTDEMLRQFAVDERHYAMLRDLGIASFLSAPLIARGRVIGAITFIGSASGVRFDEADRTLAEEAGRRVALSVDNSRLYLEARARTAREVLINAVGRKLRASLDAADILRVATSEVGLALGASRVLWSRLDAGHTTLEVSPQQYTAPGVDPVQVSYALSTLGPAFLDTWTVGNPIVIHDTETDFRLQSYWGQPARMQYARALISCPIIQRGEWGGVFSVQQCGEPRRWTRDEVALVMAVSDLLGLALENARLYDREHRVADMLQSAFLTNIPKELPGLRLAVTYKAGLDEAHVGGDFYDALELPDGRIALVMADVSGKGLKAAVQTATVKYSLRAFAVEAAAPSLVLSRLNRVLRGDSAGLGEHFVTLFYGVFDPSSGRFVYANAGHETQIIKRAAGGVALLPANGPILGVVNHRYEQNVEYLNPGDSVIMFTDGL